VPLRLAVRGVAVGDVAHPRLSASGQQDAAQHRTERLRVDVRPRARSDRLGDGIGLLGGEPALLDGEGDRVAGRPGGRGAEDLAVRVAADDPRVSWATPGSARPTARGATTRPPSSGCPPGSTTSCPSRVAVTWASVRTSTPTSSRSSRSDSLAAAPKISNGALSGV
jgi:hypothetical protein